MALVTDQALLYTSEPPTQEVYLRAEHYYLTLWTSPLAFKALFHLVLITPIFTLCIRVSRYTEAALYFDGISLLFSLLTLGVYTGSTIPNLRRLACTPSTEALSALVRSSLSSGHLGTEFDPSSPMSFINRFLMILSYPTSVLMKPSKIEEAQQAFKKSLESNPITDESRKELLSVTAAGHSIAIFLLVGILVLQAGKIYAEIEDVKLISQHDADKANHVSGERKEQ